MYRATMSSNAASVLRSAAASAPSHGEAHERGEQEPSRRLAVPHATRAARDLVRGLDKGVGRVGRCGRVVRHADVEPQAACVRARYARVRRRWGQVFDRPRARALNVARNVDDTDLAARALNAGAGVHGAEALNAHAALRAGHAVAGVGAARALLTDLAVGASHATAGLRAASALKARLAQRARDVGTARYAAAGAAELLGITQHAGAGVRQAAVVRAPLAIAKLQPCRQCGPSSST